MRRLLQPLRPCGFIQVKLTKPCWRWCCWALCKVSKEL